MNSSRIAVLALVVAASLAPTACLAQAEAASPTAPGDSGEATIRPDLLAKMFKLIATIGVDGQMPGSITAALGMPATAGQTWPYRQLAVQSSGTGTVHAIAVSRGDDTDLMLSVRGPAAISIFRIHRDGTLVSGVNYFLDTKQATPLSAAQARAGLAGERTFWMTNIDSLIAGN